VVASPEELIERRQSGLLRVPFVRRCRLDMAGVHVSGFIVNINVLGAYVALDALPSLGQSIGCRFGLPGTEQQIEVEGTVAWVNPRQQHPVHSLPPGFGLKFREISADAKRRIELLIAEYIARHPPR